MKQISFILNFITILLIVITPSFFHNDFTSLADCCIIFSLILNLILFKFRNYTFLKSYLVISICQIMYCLITVSSNSELNHQRSRIFELFSYPEIFGDEFLTILESTSMIVFAIFLFLEICFIYINLLRKKLK